jgi:RNA polymerase sigma-70 factor (ECF subfamily)
LRLLANPADAEEATQEIFVRALRAAQGFRHESQMTTWLYQITTNYCLNLIRDRSRRATLHEERIPPREDSTPTAEAHPEERVFIRGLLARADERQAAAAVYVFVDGMSHEEAASVLGVSKRTVGNLIERFQAWAESQGEEPPAKEPARGALARLLGWGRRR